MRTMPVWLKLQEPEESEAARYKADVIRADGDWRIGRLYVNRQESVPYIPTPGQRRTLLLVLLLDVIKKCNRNTPMRERVFY